MKRIGMAILALGLITCGARAQQTPAKAPATAPATSPAKGPAKGPAAAAAPAPAAGQELSTEKDKLSYAIGMEMGKGVKAGGLDVDTNLMMRGLKDAISGGKSLMTEEELRQVITKVQQEIRQKQTQAAQAAAAENKTKGEAFLTENAKKDGVVALPDGLQYKIVTAGQGKKPAETDTVLCNYKGTFLDGTEFDSSARAGKPVPFEVKNVIPGFKEILQLMPVGSKWQVFIPSSLAYGERGAGNVIGPNSTLIFEIELVGIQDNPPPASGAPPASAPQTKE
ncbi:MAG TPA: FKBP-type peptidyl-prolyl cis-trans isomerase [Candidatus Acidoferrales bacterium]|nr:FKBP-type peptidyl-prolyl cis-trans isomerase [Candidatus Acidoferrales bacterium]